jgi:hypothetical protein
MITVPGDLLAACIGKTRIGETPSRIFGIYFRSRKIRAIQEFGSVKQPTDYTLISMHGQMGDTYHPSVLSVTASIPLRNNDDLYQLYGNPTEDRSVYGRIQE